MARNLGAVGSAPKPTAASKSSRNRSPLIVGSSSTTSRARSRTREMLAHVGLLTPDECQQIVRGLSEIQAEIEAGRFAFVLEREDIHMHVEAALIERLGDVGRKLHTARSRNDQVATDVKLWTREALDRIDARLRGLAAGPGGGRRAAPRRDPARLHAPAAGPAGPGGALLPGLRREARPRPRPPGRLPPAAERPAPGRGRPGRHDACRSTASTSPRRSGSTAVAANSLDVSSDRDFVLESVFVLTLIAEHLSGWAEEWVLWSTQEFGFLALPDAICTGSSIMPQKKNPDVLELIRGRTARVIGALTHAPGARQGAAPGLQPRPPGGQGAAVRRVRHGRGLPRAGGRRRRRCAAPRRPDRRAARRGLSSTPPP